jgi:outer membrane lipoprotein-sorting protein
VLRIQKAYEGIKDIKGSFVQKNYMSDLKRTDTYQGRFFIKKPQLKWEYSGDKAQTIYISKDTILLYQKQQNRVLKSKFDRAIYGQAPIALLAGFGDITKDFALVSSSSELLVLTPKKPIGNVTRIEIRPSEEGFPIASLTIVDTIKNRIEITLKDVTTNTGIKSSTFSFKIPKDATVLEQ